MIMSDNNISRRKFLRNSALATAGTMMIPNFLKAFEINHLNKKINGEKILVIIQLSGGNDGLNTVIPYTNDIYYKSRPSIAIEKEKILKINDELGLNPGMTGFKNIYDQGLISIINKVGYPNPDRSHFRSMDIWQTASDSNQFLTSGWVGRYLDAACNGTCLHPYDAIEVDDTLSLALKGEKLKGMAVQNAQKLFQSTRDPYIDKINKAQPQDDSHENVSYLYKTLSETISSASYIYDKSKIYKTKANYPKNDIGNKLKTVSELIISGVETNVFYVSISGFDTHFAQNGKQNDLLKQYSDAIEVFVNDLKENQKLDDTLVMTFSEFGRRVAQNGSNGTDHGTANNLFLIGGQLKKPGLFNNAPDLLNLDEGDLKFEIDFRNIYSTLIQNWLKTDSNIILGKSFLPLSLV